MGVYERIRAGGISTSDKPTGGAYDRIRSGKLGASGSDLVERIDGAMVEFGKPDNVVTPPKQPPIQGPVYEAPSVQDLLNKPITGPIRKAGSMPIPQDIINEAQQIRQQDIFNPLADPQRLMEYKQRIGEMNPILAGAMRGAATIADTQRALQAPIRQMVGSAPIPKQPQARVLEEERQKAMADKSFLQNIPESLAQTMTQMIPSIATGGTMGLGMIGLQAGAQNADQALSEGATPAQALAYGGITGVAEALYEKWLGFVPGLKGFGGKATSELVFEGGKKTLKKSAADFGKKALGEGLEEVAMEPTQQISKGLLYDDNVEFRPYTWGFIGEQGALPLQRMAEAGALGTLAGALMGSVQIPAQIAESRAMMMELRDNIEQDLLVASKMPINSKSYRMAEDMISGAEGNINFEAYKKLAKNLRTEVPQVQDYVRYKRSQSEYKGGYIKKPTDDFIPVEPQAEQVTPQAEQIGKDIDAPTKPATEEVSTVEQTTKPTEKPEVPDVKPKAEDSVPPRVDVVPPVPTSEKGPEPSTSDITETAPRDKPAEEPEAKPEVAVPEIKVNKFIKNRNVTGGERVVSKLTDEKVLNGIDNLRAWIDKFTKANPGVTIGILENNKKDLETLTNEAYRRGILEKTPEAKPEVAVPDVTPKEHKALDSYAKGLSNERYSYEQMYSTGKELLDAIKNRNFKELHDRLHRGNHTSLKLFKEITGLSTKTQKETDANIRSLDPVKYDAWQKGLKEEAEAKKAAEKQEAQEQKERKKAEELEEAANSSISYKGKVMSLRDYAKTIFDEGYRLTSTNNYGGFEVVNKNTDMRISGKSIKAWSKMQRKFFKQEMKRMQDIETEKEMAQDQAEYDAQSQEDKDYVDALFSGQAPKPKDAEVEKTKQTEETEQVIEIGDNLSEVTNEKLAKEYSDTVELANYDDQADNDNLRDSIDDLFYEILNRIANKKADIEFMAKGMVNSGETYEQILEDLETELLLIEADDKQAPKPKDAETTTKDTTKQAEVTTKGKEKTDDRVDEEMRDSDAGESATPPQEVGGDRKAKDLPMGKGEDGEGSGTQDIRADQGEPTEGPTEDGPDTTRSTDSINSQGTRDTESYDVSESIATNFRLSKGDVLAEGGKVARFNNNIKAIKLLKELEETGRMATKEEQVVLSKYVGWGGIKEAFDKKYDHDKRKYVARTKSWEKRFEQLEKLLTKKEYEAAAFSVVNAHYTSTEVIDAMYRMVKRMGFNGGKILEPASGVGNFIGMLPSDLVQNSSFFGSELDSITGRIAKKLYPEAEIRVSGFEDVKIPDNYFDLAISNVPFGNIGVYDKDYPSFAKSLIHNYFFAKSLDKVKEGGLIAFITSTGTMDKSSQEFRNFVRSKADLIAAFRMPSDTFKDSAATEVTTDIIILRKRSKGEKYNTKDFMENKPAKIRGVKGLEINEYFVDNPTHVLGTLAADKQFANRVVVNPKGDTLAKLDELIAELPENIFTVGNRGNVEEITPEQELELFNGEKEGSIVKHGDKVVRIVDGKAKEIKTVVGDKNLEKTKKLIDIKSAVKELITFQKENTEDYGLKELQTKLNKLYDEFVKKHGYVSEPKNKKLADDPEEHLVTVLEIKKKDRDGNVHYVKSDIFSKRVTRGYVRATSANNVDEALKIVEYEDGKVNIPRIAELVGVTEDKAIELLGDSIYENPEGAWETASEYLSGNVKDKLLKAIEASNLDPNFERNVTALKNVQPKPKELEEITIAFGAAWIPKETIEDFLNTTFNVSNAKAEFSHVSGKWNLDLQAWFNDDFKSLAIGNLRPIDLLNKTINSQRIEVTYRDSEGTTRIDTEKTAEARAKSMEIIEKFKEYYSFDTDISDALVKAYNDKVNLYTKRVFSKEKRKYIGMSDTYEMRPHQTEAIERIVKGNNVLLAHEVGFGKTFIMIAGAMELKRLGIANKPLMVVPKDKLDDFKKDFQLLYPQSKVLVADEKDFSGDKAKKLFAKIATNDWDCVIIHKDALIKIPVSKELESEYYQREIDELEMTMVDARQSGEKRYTISDIQGAIKTLKDKQKAAMEKKKHEVATIEEMGIDYLFVDEAHEYKNLAFSTSKARVKGINNGYKAFTASLHMKSQYISSLHGGKKGLVFATGTPISNALNEAYTMFKYLRPDILETMGMQSFDAWVSNFGLIQAKIEAKVGGKFETVERFRDFYNIKELYQHFEQFADMKFDATEIGIPQPKLENGKPTVVELTEHPDHERVLKEVILARLDKVPSRPKKGDDTVVAIMGTAMHEALDMRLVYPSAEDYKDSKVNRSVENVVKEYKEMDSYKGTQLVFIDKGGNNKTGFSLYHDMVDKLVKQGIPKKEIALYADYDTKDKKEALFADVNDGVVRVLIGTYEKMSTGLNVQKRLGAIHELNTPYKPAQILQAEGRMIRQGNTHIDMDKPVKIYRYVTVGSTSADVMKWQIIETKIKAINNLMIGQADKIEAEEDEADDMAKQAELIKALALNDGRVFRKMDIEKELPALSSARNLYYQTQSRYRRTIETGPEKIEKSKRLLKETNEDIKKFNEFDENEINIVIDGKTYNQKKTDKFEKDQPKPADVAGNLIKQKVEDSYAVSGYTKLGMFKGLGVSAQFQSADSVYLDGYTGRISIRGLTTGSGIANKINREIADTLKIVKKNLEEEIRQTEGNIKTAKEKINNDKYPREQEYLDMIAEKTLIDTELETNVPLEESKTEFRPGASKKSPKAELAKNFPEYSTNENSKKDLETADQAIQELKNIEEYKFVDAEGKEVKREIKTVGKRLSTELVQKGGFRLIGRKAKDIHELAEIAQVFRDPRYETSRYIFVKGNKIVHYEGVTCAAAGIAYLNPHQKPESEYREELRKTTKTPSTLKAESNKAWIKELGDIMERVGADGFYIMHNHPSGDVTPSWADRSATGVISKHVDGFKGHLIINHNKYSVLEANNETGDVDQEEFVKEFEKVDRFISTKNEHPLLDKYISGNKDLGKFALDVKNTNEYSTIFYITTKNKILGVQEIPNEMISNRGYFMKFMKRRAITFGTHKAVLVMDESLADEYRNAADLYISYGYMLDVAYVNKDAKTVSTQRSKGWSDDPSTLLWMGIREEEHRARRIFPDEKPVKPFRVSDETETGGIKLTRFDEETDEFEGLYFAEDQEEIVRKVSKFYANTLKRINDFTDEQRSEFEPVDGEYTVKSEAESLKEAKERLIKDFDGEVEKIRRDGIRNGVDTDVAMGILEVYRDEGEATGDYGKMKEWARVIRRQGATPLGQGIQAFNKYSRTPEHIISEIEGILDDYEDKTKTKTPEIIGDIDNETKVVGKILDEADKKAKKKMDSDLQREMEEDAKEIDPAELLAIKIKNAIRGPKTVQKDVIKEMVDELYQKFRETDTDKKLPKKLEPNRLANFLDAIQNKDVSDKVWQKAKEIVRKRYKHDKAVLEMIDNYFGKGTKPPFSEKTAKLAINQVMKKLGYKISDIVKGYYAVGAQQRVNILEYMKAEARLQKLNDDEINVLANYVDSKFKEWRKEFADEYLQKLYKARGKNPASLERKTLEFINTAVNVGIFLNQRYSNRVVEKLNPKIKTLIRSSGIKLHELVKMGRGKVEFKRDEFVDNLKSKLKISQEDAERVAMIARVTFNQEANKARERILKGMLKVKSTKKRTRMFDKVLELINLDAYSIPAIRDIIKQKEGLPALDNEDIAAIVEAVNARNEVEQDSYMYRLLTSKIETIMANKVPATMFDKVKGLQRVSLLLNPKTNIRNIGGNILLGSVENVKDLVGAPIDLITGRIRGSERTTLFNPIQRLKWQLEGAGVGVKESMLDVKNSFDKEFSRDMSLKEIYDNLMTFQKLNSSGMGERYNIKRGRIFDNKTLNFLDQTTNALLSIGDRPFYEAAYHSRLKELMKIKKLKQKTDEVEMLARLFALDRVFQNDSELSKRLTKIRDQLGLPGVVVFPFTQTPANIYDKLLDYTPVGFGKAMWEMGKLSQNRKVRKFVQGEFDQKVFVDRMARTFTGAGIVMLGIAMTALGLATGGDDKNEEVREHERLSKQAYSFKIGGKWYSYEQLQPISGVLAMGIDLYNSAKDKDNPLTAFRVGFDAAGATFVRGSFMRNAIDILGAVSGFNGSVNAALTRLVSNAVSQTTPTVVKQLASVSDDYVRETYDPNPVKQFTNRYISRIPGLSRTLPRRVNIYGDDIKRYDDANNVLNVMFNPIFIKGVDMTPVQKEITDVFAKTSDKSILPRTEEPKIRFTYEGVSHTIVLDAQQYINYQKLSGKLLNEMAKETIASSEYKALKGTPYEYEVKAKVFSDLVSDAHRTSRKYTIEEYADNLDK